MPTYIDTDDCDILPIGQKQGCLIIIAGFEAYQSECAQKKISKLMDEKQLFIDGKPSLSHNFSDVETFDRWIEIEKNRKLYKVQCACGNTLFMSRETFLKKRWRDCGENCLRKKERENAMLASYPRVESSGYNIDFVNNTHESLLILGCINDRLEGKPIVHNQRKKGAGSVPIYKLYHCRCELCGREYDFRSDKFIIRNDAYGSRATWGYYCEAFCDCHSISSFQWRTLHILHKHKVPYKVEVSFADLLSEKGIPLRFDYLIYNKDGSIKCLIECQGKQHYEIGNGYGGYASLRKRQERDNQKREYAKEKDITLIEIPYTYDTYEKEEKYLFQVGVLE